ncbi:MAG: protein-export chaperone SecB [Ghiorsea sp.]
MGNTVPNKEEETTDPIFRLQRVYMKDISFENPNAPEIFERSGSKQPKVDMNLAMNHRKVADDHWEVSLKITVETRDQDTDKLLFEIEVEQAALFYMKNIPEQHMAMVLAVDCPTIILPYTRQIVSQLTVDGGFMPFLLEPVNFRALFENKLQEHKAKEAEKEPTIQ